MHLCYIGLQLRQKSIQGSVFKKKQSSTKLPFNEPNLTWPKWYVIIVPWSSTYKNVLFSCGLNFLKWNYDIRHIRHLSKSRVNKYGWGTWYKSLEGMWKDRWLTGYLHVGLIFKKMNLCSTQSSICMLAHFKSPVYVLLIVTFYFLFAMEFIIYCTLFQFIPSCL
jgi:hypothetical protein